MKKETIHNSQFTIHERKSSYAGFTLVEMIVAIFLFTVVMVVAAGALVNMLDTNRRSQATKAVMNNLNFALDSITREVRVGTGYSCDFCGPTTGDDEFDFIDKDGNRVYYRLVDDENGVGTIERWVDPPGGGAENFLALTSPEVDVETLQFFLSGVSVGDNIQPHVFILVRGIAGVTVKTKVPFDLETIVTQRFLDR